MLMARHSRAARD